MTETQLYMSIGLPVLAILLGPLTTTVQFTVLKGRMSSLEKRLSELGNKFDTKFDMLVGKVFEIDNRLTRLEERLKH